MNKTFIKVIILLTFACFLVTPLSYLYAGGPGVDAIDIGIEILWFDNWGQPEKQVIIKKFDIMKLIL